MRVAVLMSTWNGERFVEEQLRSILRQLPPDGRVIVRDDGSTDDTVGRILAVGDPRVDLLRGENVGFARSFFALLDAAPDEAEVIMLSDQDDVWLPGKVERACSRIAAVSAETPALYCSRQQLVDENLRAIGISPAWPRPPSFRNALTQNIAVGCTIALNRAALVLARLRGGEARLQFHDWWLYLVVAAFGQVLADPEPTVLYRQHAGNAIGTRPGWGQYVAKWRFIRRSGWLDAMYLQIDTFRAIHGPRLPAAERLLLVRYFSREQRGSRLRLLLTPVRFRQTLVDELLFRLLLLANLHTGQRRVGPDA